MDWWLWILLGLLLFLAELTTPGGFYIFFFGIGAVIVGILVGFQAAGPPWFQFILFSAISVLCLWLFREKLLQLTRGPLSDNVGSLVGEVAVPLEDISVNSVGKAELHGTSWNTRNIGDKPLARGQRCRVERVEGLMIFVRAESN
ncbi:MAG: NfeD family protein [Candidatus Binatia bacterium]|jgi:membrane protein implicated in regulation of membrane protease activity